MKIALTFKRSFFDVDSGREFYKSQYEVTMRAFENCVLVFLLYLELSNAVHLVRVRVKIHL